MPFVTPMASGDNPAAYARDVTDLPATPAATPSLAPSAGSVGGAEEGPVWTIVVAGGGGTRYGSAKQYAELAGRRVIEWSVDVAAATSDGVVAVVPADDVAQPVRGADQVVAGGDTRARSVRAGLAAVPPDAGVVLVHDAARPAASRDLFRRVIAAVRAGADAVVPAVAVTDSLRQRDGRAVDRSKLVAVQTPQGFRAAVLREAHAAETDASDDATLAELAGAAVAIVEGEPTNIKLTHPHEAALIESVLSGRVTIS